MRRLFTIILIVVLIAPTLIHAQSAEPITFRSASSAIIRTLDPQLVDDDLSVNVVNNLFIGLTTVDPVTQKIVPALATKWDKNEDGSVWTFTLRTDVPWVKWDSASQKGSPLRNIVAADVEYGVKRVCDPRLGAQYAVIMSSILKGCADVAKLSEDQVSDDTLNGIGVKAIDDSHVQMTLVGPLTYFLLTTPMSMYRPVPREVLKQFGSKWTRVQNIVTSGAFVLDQYDRNVNRVLVRNPLLPKDLQGPGNLQRLSVIVVKDSGTVYAKYQNNELDVAGPPAAELDKIRKDPQGSKELSQNASLAVVYLGFAFDKPPFDNVHVRRAVSAAIDRKALLDGARQGLGLPIAHLMPPGIFGAVPINEVQIGETGTDVDYAKAELVAGGFPNCQNLPTIKFITQAGAGDEATFIQNALAKNLGCDPAKIEITELESETFISSIKPNVPTQQRPNMYLGGWAADYPDAQNWMHDLLSCNAENDFKRPCDDTDPLIDLAQLESDRQKRLAMYRDLETRFFAKDGIFPIAPLFTIVGIGLTKPWVTGPFATDGLYGGAHFDWINIDQKAQLAAGSGK